MISEHHQSDLVDAQGIVNDVFGIAKLLEESEISAEYVDWGWIRSKLEGANIALVRVIEAVE